MSTLSATSDHAPILPRIRVAVLLAVHNRRETTLRCLTALLAAASDAVQLEIHLVDDGSTDGTSATVRERFPQVKVIPGDGGLYWNGAMLRAWSDAVNNRPDFYLWLNDDTALRRAALDDMLAEYYVRAKSYTRTIVVGRTVSQEGKTTYGGYIRPSALRLRFRRLAGNESLCDTFNGNCVLIPGRATVDIGILSPRYTHAFGDNDYGLRARKAGYQIVEMKPPVAVQEQNVDYARDTARLTFSNWRYILFHPKGVPIIEWYSFCREHGGRLWPVNFVFRYLKMVARGSGS